MLKITVNLKTEALNIPWGEVIKGVVVRMARGVPLQEAVMDFLQDNPLEATVNEVTIVLPKDIK